MWLTGRAWWWYQAGVFAVVQLASDRVAALMHGSISSLASTLLTYCAVVALAELALFARRRPGVIPAVRRGCESSAVLSRDT